MYSHEHDAISVMSESNNSLTPLDSGSTSPSTSHKPILVGYAFGPKKMKSMSIIMAEASMSVSTVVTHLPPHLRYGNLSTQIYCKSSKASNKGKRSKMICESAKDELSLNLQDLYKENIVHDDDNSSINSVNCHSVATECFDFDPWMNSCSGSDDVSLHRITCIFPKSFHLTNSLSHKCGDGSCSLTATSASSSSGIETMHMQPMRVSFVPLDLDIPLEEQHGGEFDVILHKMTEDILCKSQLSVLANDHSAKKNILESERQALNRVRRLQEYKDRHPSCSLVDHPTNVQALMSRSDIAVILSSCLTDITTKSGIKVRTPRFQILNGSVSRNAQGIADQISAAGFKYPLIVKPLTAAGTAQSHKMGILLGTRGLVNITEPSLLQEYSNHDGILYKVYVLGDKQWVFCRPSLPNLPEGETGGAEAPGFVEFDSQRPYPTLHDFGIKELDNDTNSIQQHHVTSSEIRPVADCMRRAFGLELFGFDILVTSINSGREREMLVVDVNYFPSYKEVPNFSQLLAQYLAQCGVEGRLRSLDER